MLIEIAQTLLPWLDLQIFPKVLGLLFKVSLWLAQQILGYKAATQVLRQLKYISFLFYTNTYMIQDCNNATCIETIG